VLIDFINRQNASGKADSPAHLLMNQMKRIPVLSYRSLTKMIPSAGASFSWR